eukprot:m.12839 g.12839  ORF g.12839 m.12839 type:complete len:558 (-) comp3263_c0_seq1:200-1873(-)
MSPFARALVTAAVLATLCTARARLSVISTLADVDLLLETHDAVAVGLFPEDDGSDNHSECQTAQAALEEAVDLLDPLGPETSLALAVSTNVALFGGEEALARCTVHLATSQRRHRYRGPLQPSALARALLRAGTHAILRTSTQDHEPAGPLTAHVIAALDLVLVGCVGRRCAQSSSWQRLTAHRAHPRAIYLELAEDAELPALFVGTCIPRSALAEPTSSLSASCVHRWMHLPATPAIVPGLEAWVRAHDRPALSEWTATNALDLLDLDVPLVVLYLPLGSVAPGLPDICATTANASSCQLARDSAAAAAFPHIWSGVVEAAQQLSHPPAEECSDCLDLMGVGAETDCADACARRLAFVWTDAVHHPNASRRSVASLELTDFDRGERFSLQKELDDALGASRVLEAIVTFATDWGRGSLVPAYAAPPPPRHHLHLDLACPLLSAAVAVGLVAHVGPARPWRWPGVVASLLLSVAVYVATQHLLGRFPDLVRGDVLAVALVLAAQGVLRCLSLSLRDTFVRYIVRPCAVAIPSLAVMFPDASAEAVHAVQCAMGVCGA